MRLGKIGGGGRHTEICVLVISVVNRRKAKTLDSRNLAVSKIHLLKMMTLELKEIHALTEVSVNTGDQFIYVLIGLLHHIESWMNLRSWRFHLLNLWIDSWQHWCSSIPYRTADVCRHALLLTIFL